MVLIFVKMVIPRREKMSGKKCEINCHSSSNLPLRKLILNMKMRLPNRKKNRPYFSTNSIPFV